jgi:16S rRNA (guanine527-N7)-methyltransferase
MARRPGATTALPSANWVAERLAPVVEAHRLPPLDRGVAELLARYLGLFLPWNARVNLSAARSAEAVVDAHLADGIALLPHLPAGPATLVDVGAGAGFVGVLVASARPDVRCALVEPSTKRHTFLRAVARELPLPNVEPLAERLEEHLARPGRPVYDVAVSRATWAPPDWLARAEALLRPGGLAFAFEGARRSELPAGVERLTRPDGRGSLLRKPHSG